MSWSLFVVVKWLWCLMVLYTGPIWNPVRCVTVRTPPSDPSTIEAQAKFFQYRHFPSADDYDQGHRLGSERHFTERHERSRPSTGLFSAKVRWGDKKGGYGEHYWDLNHAGHAGDHGHDGYDDDGSYHDRDSSDTYNEPSEQSPNYDTTNYDVEKASQEDVGREKRAPKKIRPERVQESEESDEEEKPQVRRRPTRKQKEKEQKQTTPQDNQEEEDANQEVYRRPAKQRRPHNQQQYEQEEYKPPKEKNQVVLVVDEKEKEEKPVQSAPRQSEPKLFVPYEGGAGVRQHYQAEATPAASVPRLFLEPATGHVVDRATGQAYVLQPIIRNPTYS